MRRSHEPLEPAASDRAHWERVCALFDEAVALAPAARERFLDEACGSGTALREEVASLLAHDEAPPAILAGRASPDALLDALEEDTDILDADAARVTGALVGPYRIVRELGRGGMGVVHLAERTDVPLRVALKLVRGGLAAPGHVARFARERRVLARLQHGNIAQLLDVGVSEDGAPYLAMEYVDGAPIDRWCDERRLPVADRLALFGRVCEAVEYAHRNLVVHRDLKPSNVFVSADGMVKLLDFGIAKLLGGETGGEDTADPEQAPLTGLDVRLMTPEYAAPEQVRGEEVSTSTDVYALGVLLYELLAGCRPHRLLGRSLGAIEQAVLVDEPMAPSVAATRLDPDRSATSFPGGPRSTPEAIAAARGTNPGVLRARLAGDLDIIVLRALEKDPERRYASAAQLADDVRRHLDGRPIVARRATRSYRLGKFVGRNRVGVAAGVGLTLLGAAFVATTVFQLRSTGQERDRAEAALAVAEEARNRAQREQQTSARVGDFLAQLFTASDPFEAQGETVTARELLDRGVARIDALDGEPEVQAQMLLVLQRVYRNLGRYERTLALSEGALAVQQRQHAGAHPDVAMALNEVGIALELSGLRDSAIVVHGRALAMRRRVHDASHPDVAQSLSNLATALFESGDPAAADTLYREALAIYRVQRGPRHLSTIALMQNLARTHDALGNYRDAETLARETLALRREVNGPRHPEVGALLNNLASTLTKVGRASEAEALLQESLRIKRAAYPPRHPSIAASLYELGLAYSKQGNRPAAETVLREALSIQQAQLGASHAKTSATTLALETLGGPPTP